MKLWQAILIGCDRRAQAFGSLYVMDDADADKCTSCTLGAAYEALFNRMGGDETENEYASLEELYPVLNELIAPASEDELPITVEDKIISLNDDDRWPREKIALEFVKPIEEAMEENAG